MKNLPKTHPAFHDFTNLKPTEKAYWAGLLDGEGCLKIFHNNGVPTPHIQLKMTCSATVEAFAETFGCNVILEPRSDKVGKEHLKDCFIAKVTGHKAAKICEALQEFHLTKKNEAKTLASHYTKTCGNCGEQFWAYMGKSNCC